MYKYDNSGVRRQDRLLDEARAMELLSGGEYGFLALASDKGGYGLPMSYMWDGENVWFHCAPEGEKLRAMVQNDNACFCVVGETSVQSSKFTTLYESVMVFGRVTVVEAESERNRGIELIVEKYSPEFKEQGRRYAAASMHRTVILKLEAERISGKRKG